MNNYVLFFALIFIVNCWIIKGTVCIERVQFLTEKKNIEVDFLLTQQYFSCSASSKQDDE